MRDDFRPMIFLRPSARQRLILMMMILAGTLLADAPTVTAPREFIDSRGRKMVAVVVSIDLKNVVLKRQSDQKEFTFPITQLSERDQVFLAENRAELGKATSTAMVEPLPTRVVTGTEVAKAKRFAKEVLMDDRKGGGGVVFKWNTRPKLTVNSSDPALGAFGQKAYDDLCDAAGFIGKPDAKAEIILCVGTSSEVEKLKQKLAPGANKGGSWTWHYRWTGLNYTAFVFFVPMDGQETDNKRQIIRGIAAVFGCPGSSDEFPGSMFKPKSETFELSPIDRQLIRLIYTQLGERPSRDNLLLSIDKNWASMVAPPKPAAAP